MPVCRRGPIAGARREQNPGLEHPASDPARTLSIRPYYQYDYTWSCESHGPPTAHSYGQVNAEVSGHSGSSSHDFPGKSETLWSGSSDYWDDGSGAESDVFRIPDSELIVSGSEYYTVSYVCQASGDSNKNGFGWSASYIRLHCRVPFIVVEDFRCRRNRNRPLASRSLVVNAQGRPFVSFVPIVSFAIQDASKIGGDLGHAATDVVTGAIHAARELGVSAEEAASAAAHGALTAAEKVGGAALETVRNALTGTIAGVKVVLKEPFRNRKGK